MGTHYPAMVLVEVKALLHEEALVEVEAIALV
jgi:enamine deaminase RidA (YjgF/YER057c/UK114 family)